MSEEKKELTETEKKIFEAIAANDIVVLKALLVEKQNVNFVDPENLMTPLQHAAYKGDKDVVQALIDQGADPNLCEHQHNYTALHFAGLSGNVDVCLALLLAGAKTGVLNTVNRTASQMAAFVGNHACVAVINNYIPKADVDCYTKPQEEQDKPPLLSQFLADSFHKFIMQVNIHPVKVLMNLQAHVGLSDHLGEIKKVLELMSEKEMKRGAETNEVMSFKFHYLSYVVGEMVNIQQRNAKSEDDKKLDITEFFTRRLLKPGKDGNLEHMDAFLRECVREFPFRESTLFRQMVTSLTSKDPPSAFSIISSAINGQRGFLDVSVCSTCGEEKPGKKCSKCKAVQYCDRSCQRLHWHWHKKACARLGQLAAAAAAAAAEAEPRAPPDPAEISADLQNLLVN